jgi:membrane protease subunit (stomatin/prohibitin family)
VEEKNMRKRLNKDINNEYVKMFQDKVAKDQEKERQELEALKAKSREVQQFVLDQIEEKRQRTKGMTIDEFDFNKDLLKEIIHKKKEIQETIQMHT